MANGDIVNLILNKRQIDLVIAALKRHVAFVQFTPQSTREAQSRRSRDVADVIQVLSMIRAQTKF